MITRHQSLHQILYGRNDSRVQGLCSEETRQMDTAWLGIGYNDSGWVKAQEAVPRVCRYTAGLCGANGHQLHVYPRLRPEHLDFVF